MGITVIFLLFKINGSVQMEHALLYTFLKVSPDCKFKEQLHSLQNEWFQWQCAYSYDDAELQTDGNQSGQMQNGEPGESSLLHPT